MIPSKSEEPKYIEGKGRMKEFGPFHVVAYVGDQMGDFPDGFSSELNHILFAA